MLPLLYTEEAAILLNFKRQRSSPAGLTSCRLKNHCASISSTLPLSLLLQATVGTEKKADSVHTIRAYQRSCPSGATHGSTVKRSTYATFVSRRSSSNRVSSYQKRSESPAPSGIKRGPSQASTGRIIMLPQLLHGREPQSFWTSNRPIRIENSRTLGFSFQ